jgi:predicted SAM-dependent methyltransferase
VLESFEERIFLGGKASMGFGIRTYAEKRMSQGPRAATDRWFDEWALFRLHRRESKRAQQLLRPLPVKLHLGCGPNRKEGWINIDLFDKRADLQLDLRENWPFPDNCASYIYSEHVFEHFEFHNEVPHFLGEAFRVLMPGGCFDVVVPDSGPPLKAYNDPHASYWSTEAKRWHPAWCETELDHINYHFRQDGEHKYAWDAETLQKALQKAGFKAVMQRAFDPELDTEDRRIGSLSMMSKKP